MLKVSTTLLFVLLILLFPPDVCAQQSDRDFIKNVRDSLDLNLESDERLADSLDRIGIDYRNQGSPDAALAYVMLALRIRENIQSENIKQSYLILGSIAGLREKYDLSIEYFEKARALSLMKDSVTLSKAYNNLGLSYTSLKEYDSALKYHQLAIAIKENHPQTEFGSLLKSYLNLGHTYEKLDEYDSALMYFRRVLSGSDSTDHPVMYAHATHNIGYMNYLLDNRDTAAKYYQLSLRVAERDSITEVLEPLYHSLVLFNINDTGNYFFHKYWEKRNQILDMESEKRIMIIEADYEWDKMEDKLSQNQLELEKQQANNRLYLIVGGSLILILSGLLAFLMYRQKLMEQLRKKDEDLHNQQVNDIIRNQELSILSARVEGQDMERQRIAEDLHDRLGSKLAAVKLYYDAAQGDNPDETLVKAKKLLNETIDETRRIAHNLSSGVLTRFGLVAAIEHLKETLENSRQIEIEFITHNFERHSLSKDLEINFYRIIQELISNILKHARATHVTIQLTRHEDGTVTLIVEDNGRGFNPQNVSLASMGLENLKSRVDRYDGTLSIDSEPGHGTTVIVEIHEKQNQLV